MNSGKVFFRKNKGITVVDFNLIDGYAILPTKVGFTINVKLREQPVDSYCINSIITNLTSISTGSGILHEIKSVCLELNKEHNFDLPRWMTQTSSY